MTVNDSDTSSHLLGKKSWNVYNADNIARVKKDVAAAAAREADEEQRMQELDAERRAAILRGQTPPPLPEPETEGGERGPRRSDKPGYAHERKRRRIAGEDDTDRDIRLAKDVTAPRGEDDAPVLRLRKPKSDAPLTDHAGHINLFPIDEREAIKRERNAEAEAEKKKKAKELEDQSTMRFSNAAGRSGLDQQPWYAGRRPSIDIQEEKAPSSSKMLEFPELENKDVWGREDPRRKEREQARISSADPLVFMQKAQVQLKKSQEAKKLWQESRERELRELKAKQERDERRERHEKHRSRHRRHRSRSRSRSPHRHDQRSSHHHGHSSSHLHGHRSSHHHRERRVRSRSRDRDSERRRERKSYDDR